MAHPHLSKSSANAYTPARLLRLYRLLRFLEQAPRTRLTVLKRMKLDERGFYRDLKLLRELAIEVEYVDRKYRLTTAIDLALTLLPFPDPGLTFAEALTLSRGTSKAHEKLQKLLEAFE